MSEWYYVSDLAAILAIVIGSFGFGFLLGGTLAIRLMRKHDKPEPHRR